MDDRLRLLGILNLTPDPLKDHLGQEYKPEEQGQLVGLFQEYVVCANPEMQLSQEERQYVTEHIELGLSNLNNLGGSTREAEKQAQNKMTYHYLTYHRGKGGTIPCNSILGQVFGIYQRKNAVGQTLVLPLRR